jgi:hypothetical protein
MAMTPEEIKEYLIKENAKYTSDFQFIENVKNWPNKKETPPFKVLRNKDFLVQLFRESASVVRMTVNRTMICNRGMWLEGISWDELQEIKSKVGYGHRDAVEVYPADKDVVNVANMRHLFVLSNDNNLDFIWRSK